MINANRFNPDGVPDYLKARQQWIVWGKRSKQGIDVKGQDGRLNKIPFNPRTGKAASSNKPNTWVSFSEAINAYQSGWYNGVGFVFAEGDGLAGVDLDHCLDPTTSTPNPQTQDILSHFGNTFAEISPSCDGLHIFCFGLALHCGKGEQNKWIEVYGKDINGKRSNRYFCVTGNQFSKNLEITDGQAALAWLHNTFKAQTANPSQSASTIAGSSHFEKYVRTAFKEEISKVRNATNGARNDTLFKSAAALKELCNCDWVSPYISKHEIETALLTATNLPEKEARSTITSAFKTATGTRERPNNHKNNVDNGLTRLATSAKLAAESNLATPSDDDTLAALATLATDDKKSVAIPYADTQSPTPLQRDLDKSPQFPIHALGTLLGNAALAIFDEVQCPLSLATQSVLAAASMACQGIADIQIRRRLVFPLSGYFLSLGETGERKTGVDKLALQAHKEFERQLYVRYDEWEKRKLDAKKQDLEFDEVAPRQGHMIVEEPTYEGLTKIFQTAQPTVGIFSDEGGRILGGVAMSKENQIKTLTALSSLWCGGAISRSRAQDGTTKLYDRRLSIHLMVQPKLAMELMLSNENMQDQGFLARFLVCYPESTMGLRAYKESDPYTESHLGQYWQRMTELLGMYQYNEKGELQLKKLDITPSAKELWIGFYNYVESRLTPEGEYAEIKGFANKATEHAARLAGVIAVTDDPHTEVVSDQYMQWGIDIAYFFLAEALRLIDAKPNPDLEKAMRLLSWLQGSTAARHFKNGYINHTQIYMRGLRFARTPKDALKYMMILERHGYVSLEIKGRSKLWKLSDKAAKVSKPVANALQHTALIEGLRHIWHSNHVSGVQATLDALDKLSGEVGFMSDDVWKGITEFIAKMRGNGTKQALLSFVAARIGLIGNGDGSEWWGVN